MLDQDDFKYPPELYTKVFRLFHSGLTNNEILKKCSEITSRSKFQKEQQLKELLLPSLQLMFENMENIAVEQLAKIDPEIYNHAKEHFLDVLISKSRLDFNIKHKDYNIYEEELTMEFIEACRQFEDRGNIQRFSRESVEGFLKDMYQVYKKEFIEDDEETDNNQIIPSKLKIKQDNFPQQQAQPDMLAEDIVGKFKEYQNTQQKGERALRRKRSIQISTSHGNNIPRQQMQTQHIQAQRSHRKISKMTSDEPCQPRHTRNQKANRNDPNQKKYQPQESSESELSEVNPQEEFTQKESDNQSQYDYHEDSKPRKKVTSKVRKSRQISQTSRQKLFRKESQKDKFKGNHFKRKSILSQMFNRGQKTNRASESPRSGSRDRSPNVTLSSKRSDVKQQSLEQAYIPVKKLSSKMNLKIDEESQQSDLQWEQKQQLYLTNLFQKKSLTNSEYSHQMTKNFGNKQRFNTRNVKLKKYDLLRRTCKTFVHQIKKRDIISEEKILLLPQKFKSLDLSADRQLIHKFIGLFFCRDYDYLPVNIIIGMAQQILATKRNRVQASSKEEETRPKKEEKKKNIENKQKKQKNKQSQEHEEEQEEQEESLKIHVPEQDLPQQEQQQDSEQEQSQKEQPMIKHIQGRGKIKIPNNVMDHLKKKKAALVTQMQEKQKQRDRPQAVITRKSGSKTANDNENKSQKSLGKPKRQKVVNSDRTSTRRRRK